ncbi:hypothetical protein [Tumebacillus flagellatus]|uniref:DNA-binding protein n=1 Tax=Tumebacillus flagellatus TaxID=1157490 RepID=A0A074LW74_9BACL|nr:hypothetical protein [Tumebacillus flagellatus]KEO84308.1 DNA-binding protein [Tumebacillus flagellatus]
MQDSSFAQSAVRHLQDAQTLLDQGRFDNAVYLSGYVPECAFKTLVQLYMDQRAAREYGHMLSEIQGVAMDRLRILFPEVDIRLPKSRLDGTVLVDGHPERRYARSGIWIEEQAMQAVARAWDLFEETIVELVLDGKLSSEELRG